MPLRAQYGETRVDAFDFNEAEWADLKQTYRGKGLSMPCCGTAAIPKTSKLGNFFFAHHRRGLCDSAPETAEHIYLKTLIAKAAKSAGWSVTTEAPGKTPNGTKWIADVLCERGKARIAMEVQLSYQGQADMAARQTAYRDSKVCGAWFAGEKQAASHYIKPSKEIPIFCLSVFEVPNEPKVDGFGMELSKFVTALLNGNIRWVLVPDLYSVEYLNDTCWNCKRAVKQVIGWALDVYHDTGKTVPNMSMVLEDMMKSVSNVDLARHGLNVIGRHDTVRGKLTHWPYCNECVHCGAPQNNWYTLEKMAGKPPTGGGRDDQQHERGYVEFAIGHHGRWEYQE